MNLRRLRPAEFVLAAAAIALFVSLFLPWHHAEYTVITSRSTPYAPPDATLNAWDAYPVVAAILTACAAVALLAVILQATQRSPALPIISSVAATWAALIAFVLVLIKVFGPDPEYGVWVALAAAVGLFAGGWWAMRDDKPGLGFRRSHLESPG
jgi:hypothetical protein